MIVHARQQGIGFAWVGFDGFYGSDPAFLRALEDRGEVFVGDVHKDQRIYLEDPRPLVPPAKTVHVVRRRAFRRKPRRCASTTGRSSNPPRPGSG